MGCPECLMASHLLSYDTEQCFQSYGIHVKQKNRKISIKMNCHEHNERNDKTLTQINSMTRKNQVASKEYMFKVLSANNQE